MPESLGCASSPGENLPLLARTFLHFIENQLRATRKKENFSCGRTVGFSNPLKFPDTHTRTQTHTHTHTHTHARTHAGMHGRTYAHTHARTHTRTHAHSHTYTYTHKTHTHMYKRAQSTHKLPVHSAKGFANFSASLAMLPPTCQPNSFCCSVSFARHTCVRLCVHTCLPTHTHTFDAHVGAEAT